MKLKVSASGFSLVELLIVIVILGVVAKVAIPMFSSVSDETKLDNAANEIIQALRFARSESMRLGATPCIEAGIQPNTVNSVGIKGWTTNTSSAASFVIYHPLEKKDYQYTMGQVANTEGVVVSSVTLKPTPKLGWGGSVFFCNGGGNPYTWAPLNPVFSQYYDLISGSIVLTYNGKNRTININPLGNVY